MAKKKITVKELLTLIDEDTPVCVQLYAYGIHYANTLNDDLHTVGDCLRDMNNYCLNALVTSVNTRSNSTPNQINIQAEIVH